MIRGIVDYALNNRLIIIAVALLLFVWGAVSFHQLPVEAYPDVARQLRGNYYAVAGNRCRTNRAAGHDSARDRDERNPASGASALLLTLRPLRLKLIFDDDSNNDWNRERSSRAAFAGHFASRGPAADGH